MNNNNPKIYVFNKPDPSEIPLVYKSVKNGISRFGWSGKEENALLDRDGKRTNSWGHSFLRNIKEGDWIVHISIPKHGKCIAGRVIKTYWFDFDGGLDCSWGKDFRHCIGIDKESIVEFDRNDPNVLSRTSQNLKPRGRWQRAYMVDDFLKSLENLKTNAVKLPDGESASLYHLKQKMPYEEIAKKIWETHPNKKLEHLVCKLFEGFPNMKVTHNGTGWKSDYGADVIVEYSDIPIPNLDTNKTLVIQVKSYTWKLNDDNAVSQVEQAIKKFDADAGLIICTAPATDEMLEKIENLNSKLDKPISLLAGGEFAKFLIRHGNHLIG